MNTKNLKLFDALRKELNLSEDKARNIVEAIEDVVNNKLTDTSKEYKSLFGEDVLKLEMRLRDDINQSKLDMYKALFISSFVQLIAILGGLLAIVKFMMGK